ncbi:MAG: cytochrome c biogenesis protein ResB [Bdellovibrionales bacterium]
MTLQKKSLIRRIIKPLASLKLAVVVMVLIAVLSAIGTIIEAKWGVDHAQRLVYKSAWMVSVMILFIVNLTAVIFDRWPWQAKHSSFILAHVGLILIVVGQWVGSSYGVDGIMSIGIGGSSKVITIPNTEIQVYTSFDGVKYTRLYRDDVDFISNPPTEKKPIEYKIDNETLKFTDYKPFVVPKRDIVPAEHHQEGRAVRFQLRNENVRTVEWLFQKGTQLADVKTMGLMNVVLGPLKPELIGQNILHFEFQNNELIVTTYKKGESAPHKRWVANEADTLKLDWMNFELKLLRVLPSAKEDWELIDKDGPTPLTMSAAKLIYRDKEQWVLLNDTLKIFSDNAVFIVSYGQKRVTLDFPVALKNFEMIKYKGLNKAQEYKSIVSVPGIEDHVISMNEPLKYKGLTFYQSSFQQDEMGTPIASVLSVNYDPGRFLKYFGSLIVSIGIILLFYFRRQWSWKLKKS